MTQRKSLDVTEMDLLAELDELRSGPYAHKKTFTAEQDAALWHARGPQNSRLVIWADLRQWWSARGWGLPAERTLLYRLRELEAQGGPEAVKPKTMKRG